jgi:hypothetical protein
MAYAERSAAASLLAWTVGLAAYVWMVHEADSVLAVVPALIAMAVLATVIRATTHLGLRLQDRSGEEDERDRAIALLAARNGSMILAIAVWESSCWQSCTHDR